CHTCDLVVFQLQEEGLEARIGIDFQGIDLRQAVVEDKLADTTNAVAAHLASAAIGVVHLHAGMSSIGRTDKNQPIAANAGATVAHLPRYRYWVSNLRGKRVHIDIIVADAVHFGKRQFHNTTLSTQFFFVVDCPCHTISTVFDDSPRYPSNVKARTR